MIVCYSATNGTIERQELSPTATLPKGAVWVDLHNPTAEEQGAVGKALSLELPTLDEMREIEPSSRLYQESGASFMTATAISKSDDPNPVSDAVTFVLTPRSLVTIRYVDPKPISTFANRLIRQGGPCGSSEDMLLGLLEAFVDRMADILERVSLDLDHLSRSIFDERISTARRRLGGRRDLRVVLRSLGRNDDINTVVRESLLSISRLLRFHAQTMDAGGPAERVLRDQQRTRIKTLDRDILSLAEHSGFEAHKVNFLLDATLGMINIEQNNTIKIFSVVAVVFLPPTLIASIYGMNFHNMPELDWGLGYPFAIVLMVVAAILPYLYFKRRGWL